MATAAPAPVLVVAGGLRCEWDAGCRAQRSAAVVGVGLIAVGLVHAALWLVLGGSADGPLSWRKPTTFGISFGLTTLTLAWVAGQVGMAQRLRTATLVALSAGSTSEVLWVSVQHARGVPSHFNDSTPFDYAFFLANGVAIAVVVGVIAVYAALSFRRSPVPSLALALRVGLLVLLVAMATGVWMVLRGTAFDLPPTSNGEGSIKGLHAVGMHGIQALGGLAWVLALTAVPERRRVRLVATAAVGYVALTAAVGVVTLLGRSAVEPNLIAAPVLVASVASVLAPWAVAVAALLRTRPPSPAVPDGAAAVPASPPLPRGAGGAVESAVPSGR